MTKQAYLFARVRLLSAFTAVCASALITLVRFNLGPRVIATFDDDFFYYLKTAMNVNLIHRSSFDGIHLTNGYHPLWFLLIAALYNLHGGLGFFWLFQCLQFCLSLIVYFLLRRLFSFFSPTTLRPDAFALAILVFTLSLSTGGMEVSLFFPLAITMLWFRLRPDFKWTGANALAYGLLASLTVLARLDSLIFIALLVLGECLTSSGTLIDRSRRLLFFTVGGILIPVYATSNRIWFGTWTPVSGQAKQIRFHHWPSIKPLLSILTLHSFMLQLILWTAVIALVVSATWLSEKPRQSMGGAPAPRVLLWTMLIFPILHLMVLSVLSDWALWYWYLYSLLPVYIVIGILYCARNQEVRWLDSPRWLTLQCLAVLIFAIFSASHLRPNQQLLYMENLRLAAFMDNHPGLYAMGDRSGMLGYMTSSPIIQLEGLMMDRSYLSRLRVEKDLVALLKNYSVEYYITPAPADGAACFMAAEPAQSGTDSPKMRTTLCSAQAILVKEGKFRQQIFEIDKSARDQQSVSVRARQKP